jgi:hypothetical protein
MSSATYSTPASHNRWLMDQVLAAEQAEWDAGYKFGIAEAQEAQDMARDHELEQQFHASREADMARRAETNASAIRGLQLAIADVQRITRTLKHDSPEYIVACKCIVRMMTAADALSEEGSN